MDLLKQEICNETVDLPTLLDRITNKFLLDHVKSAEEIIQTLELCHENFRRKEHLEFCTTFDRQIKMSEDDWKNFQYLSDREEEVWSIMESASEEEARKLFLKKFTFAKWISTIFRLVLHSRQMYYLIKRHITMVPHFIMRDDGLVTSVKASLLKFIDDSQLMEVIKVNSDVEKKEYDQIFQEDSFETLIRQKTDSKDLVSKLMNIYYASCFFAYKRYNMAKEIPQKTIFYECDEEEACFVKDQKETLIDFDVRTIDVERIEDGILSPIRTIESLMDEITLLFVIKREMLLSRDFKCMFIRCASYFSHVKTRINLLEGAYNKSIPVEERIKGIYLLKRKVAVKLRFAMFYTSLLFIIRIPTSNRVPETMISDNASLISLVSNFWTRFKVILNMVTNEEMKKILVKVVDDLLEGQTLESFLKFEEAYSDFQIDKDYKIFLKFYYVIYTMKKHEPPRQKCLCC